MNMERKRVLFVFIFFFLIMSLTSCGNATTAKKKQPILLASKEVKFITEKAFKMDIDERVNIDGSVDSKKSQSLAFKREGILTWYDVYMGKEVKKGDLLAAIDIEEIDHKIKILKLKLDQDKIKIDIAKESGDALKIKDAEMELKIDQIELDKLNDYRDNYCLISEIDGLVASLEEVNLGSKVNRDKTLIRVMDKNQLCIKGFLRSEQMKMLNVGDSVQIIVNGETYESEVNEVISSEVYVKVPEELKGTITPLTKVKIQRVFKQIKDAILVPKTGIYTDSKGVSTVQVIEDGRIVTKEVVLGEEVNEYYQILKGINEGEEILVK